MAFWKWNCNWGKGKVVEPKNETQREIDARISAILYKSEACIESLKRERDLEKKKLQASKNPIPEYIPQYKPQYKPQNSGEVEELTGLTTAVKYDAGKTDWAIMPVSAMEDIIEVLKFGEKKYARSNFAEGDGLSYTRVINSLLRHIFAFMRGEDRDPESGLHHIAHAGCNIVFLLYYIKNKDKYSNDDRAKMVV